MDGKRQEEQINAAAPAGWHRAQMKEAEAGAPAIFPNAESKISRKSSAGSQMILQMALYGRIESAERKKKQRQEPHVRPPRGTNMGHPARVGQ